MSREIDVTKEEMAVMCWRFVDELQGVLDIFAGVPAEKIPPKTFSAIEKIWEIPMEELWEISNVV